MNSQTFPLQTVSQIDCNTHTSCSVCLEEFVAEKTQVRTLPCGHFFHENCLNDWILVSKTCPLCRHNLTTTSNSMSFIRPITPNSNFRSMRRLRLRSRRRSQSRGRSTSRSRSASRNRRISQRNR
jgi:hypothetical protein